MPNEQLIESLYVIGLRLRCLGGKNDTEYSIIISKAQNTLSEQDKRIEELERKLAACMGFNVTIKPSKESIAALPDGLREYITEHLQFNGEMNRLEKENANLQAELTRLRKEIIKDASDLNPHTPSCPNASLGRSAWSQIAGCTCWKSKALEGRMGNDRDRLP